MNDEKDILPTRLCKDENAGLGAFVILVVVVVAAVFWSLMS